MTDIDMKPRLPTLFRRAQNNVIWCEKCGRPVEHFQVDTPVREVRDGIMTAHEHTGEVILTVSCHGETYTIRGATPPAGGDHG